MKQYYFIQRTPPQNGASVIDTDISPEDYNKAKSGSELPDDFNFSVKVKPDYDFLPDFLSGILTIPIISKKLKEFIEIEVGNSTKFYPVSVIDSNNNIVAIYYYCHIIDVVDAFDWEKSMYTASSLTGNNTVCNWDSSLYSEHKYEKKWIRKIKKISIHEKNVGERKIFRILGINTMIFCSESFMHYLNEYGSNDFQVIDTDHFYEY